MQVILCPDSVSAMFQKLFHTLMYTPILLYNKQGSLDGEE